MPMFELDESIKIYNNGDNDNKINTKSNHFCLCKYIMARPSTLWADAFNIVLGPLISHGNIYKLVDFLIGHYTYRMFPPAIDIIPTLLAVVYSNGKYTN